MLIRVLSSTFALLSFAIVCFSGLMQGHSFGSVLRCALVALAAGGVAGVIVALVVRAVVADHFDRRHRGEETAGASATGVRQSSSGRETGKMAGATRGAGSGGNGQTS